MRQKDYSMVRLAVVCVAMLYCGASGFAGIIIVPTEQPTIQAGVDAAVDGDSVLIEPGTYVENVVIDSKSIFLLARSPVFSSSSLSSSDVAITPDTTTFIEPVVTNEPALKILGDSTTLTTVSGLLFQTGRFAIHIWDGARAVIEGNLFREHTHFSVEALYTNAVIVRNNRFEGTDGGLSILTGREHEVSGNIFTNNELGLRLYLATRTMVSRNIFARNWGGIMVFSGGLNEITNNTIYGSGAPVTPDYALRLIDNTTANIVSNNIISHSTNAYGIWDMGINNVLEYNNVALNSPANYFETSPGVGSTTDDPQFVDTSSFNFTLLAGAPGVDAGNPDPQFNDPDATRNDVGALFSPAEFPATHDLTLVAEDNGHVLNHLPTVNWLFVEPLGSQVAYEIQVNRSANWELGADTWESGETFSADNEALYGGAPLVDGVTYFIRVRLFDGSIWGDWAVRAFRMNSLPTTPEPSSFGSFVSAHFEDVELNVFRSLDAEQDPLVYEFEVAEDSEFGVIAARDTSVISFRSQGGVPIITSHKIAGMVPDNTYWWRARALDGFEASEWSAIITFTTFGLKTLEFPGEFSTIQETIDNARDRDILLLAPGTYQENLVISNRRIKLIGSGTGNTIIEPANPALPVLTITNITDTATEITGVTFTGGSESDLIVIDGVSALTIHGNRFMNNFPLQTDDLNTIYVTNSVVTIKQNLFVGNGGIGSVSFGAGTSRSEVSNNTFDRNNVGIRALSVSNTIDSGIVVINNIITNSTSSGVFGISKADFSLLDYNLIWNNNPDFFSFGGVGPGPNNVNADPQFLNPAQGNYGLLSTSPAIDAGNPDPQYNDPNGSRSDIGAFTTGCCILAGDANSDGGVNIGDVTFLIARIFAGGPAPPCPSQANADGVGTVNIADVTFMIARIFAGGPAPECGTT